jgi:hypothetical protein
MLQGAYGSCLVLYSAIICALYLAPSSAARPIAAGEANHDQAAYMLGTAMVAPVAPYLAGNSAFCKPEVPCSHADPVCLV